MTAVRVLCAGMMRVSKRKNNTFESFSEKQLRVLSWWCPSSPDRNFDAIICDGAVRSGKTVCMSVSFVAWAFSAFDDTSFALCGKTVTSLRRNIITPILPVLRRLGFDCREKLSQHLVEIEYSGRRNRFYLFGGKDEGSAALIQGMTLGGVLLDEVALMPRSFVEQALARCSLDGSKLWFNCNPDTPLHWFYEEWIKKSAEKNCLYLHFTMDDNPSLTPAIKRRYESLYSGAFYDRFVLGKWVAAQGLVYPFFSRSVHVAEPAGIPSRYFISCDYGTVNPSSFGLWGEYGGRWYRLSEYYFDSRREGEQRTDEEHYAALEQLAELFVGKTGIFDHSMSGRDQTARIFSCRVETDESKVTSAGEKYTKLCARAYMPRSEKNAALIEEIDAGIKKETSVGCSVGRSVCSICGKDGRTDPCAHIKGREYGGKLCHRILCDPTDAYEWSFVAVPAQPAAGVTKSYRADEQTVKTVKRLSCANEGVTLTKAEAAGLYGYIDELEQLAREGKEYREELICDVIRMGAAALPDMRGESLSAICGTLGLEQLRELKKAFSGGGKLNSQLSSTKPETHSGNSEFRI